MSACETTTTIMKPSSPISPRLLSHLFTSLSQSATHASTAPRRWYLRRILRSDNAADINGELTGIATFHNVHNNVNNKHNHRQMVYKEEGEMPSSVRGMAGVRWTKKYIWRLNNSDVDADLDNNPHDALNLGKTNSNNEDKATGGISIWFVKIKSGSQRSPEGGHQQEEDEADYLFHEFDFVNQKDHHEQEQESTDPVSLQPPTPPRITLPALKDAYPETKVIQARGDHLCVKDMYYTAYSFRIVPETGEVLSWASRHVVKGPKKNQDILNLYSIEG